MTTELREKMKREANEYLREMNEGGCIPNFEEDDFNAGNLYGAEHGFIEGAQAMYDELKPLVEWVSVDDRLPKENTRMLFKNNRTDSFTVGLRSGDIYFLDNDDECLIPVTHWLKIER